MPRPIFQTIVKRAKRGAVVIAQGGANFVARSSAATAIRSVLYARKNDFVGATATAGATTIASRSDLSGEFENYGSGQSFALEPAAVSAQQENAGTNRRDPREPAAEVDRIEFILNRKALFNESFSEFSTDQSGGTHWENIENAQVENDSAATLTGRPLAATSGGFLLSAPQNPNKSELNIASVKLLVDAQKQGSVLVTDLSYGFKINDSETLYTVEDLGGTASYSRQAAEYDITSQVAALIPLDFANIHRIEFFASGRYPAAMTQSSSIFSAALLVNASTIQE